MKVICPLLTRVILGWLLETRVFLIESGLLERLILRRRSHNSFNVDNFNFAVKHFTHLPSSRSASRAV